MKELTEPMYKLIVDGSEHFSRLSSTYNNILAMGAVGVDNGHGGGYETRVGNHSATICGRTYAFMPGAMSGSADPSGGLSYFTFDVENEIALGEHIKVLQMKALKKKDRHRIEIRRMFEAINDEIAPLPPLVNRDGSDSDVDDPPEQEDEEVRRLLPIQCVQESIVKKLKRELNKINPLCKELKFIGDACRDNNYNNAVIQAKLCSEVQYFDVTAVTSNTKDKRVIRIVNRFNQKSELDMSHANVEPICYPLLFQEGENGWQDTDNAIISNRHYLSSRLLKPETITRELTDEAVQDLEKMDFEEDVTNNNVEVNVEFEEDLLFFEDRAVQQYIREHGALTIEAVKLLKEADTVKKVVHECNYVQVNGLRVNRFQVMARLSQVYIVDQVSRMIDRQLNFVRNSQSLLLCGNTRSAKKYRGKNNYNRANDQDNHQLEQTFEHGDANGNDEEVNDNHFLPASVHGSPRHLKSLANNALAIISELGCTTVFITGTMNIDLPEITTQLIPGQSAFDRPDIVCQVFHQRMAAFVHNLKNGKYFGGRKTVFTIYVVEWQWRGLPHFHLCARLENVPSAANPEECFTFIDNYIHAELPRYKQGDTKNNVIRELVKTHMLHKCKAAINGCKTLETDACRRGYGTGVLVPETHINEKGFPVYRRRLEEDLNVVPYNPDIIYDWNGHINVEYSECIARVLYTYSYLYKGSKKTDFNLKRAHNTSASQADVLAGNNDGEEASKEKDMEIDVYLKGRTLSSMDAVWRTLGFQTYPSPNPHVRLIKVKTSQMVNYLLEKEKKSCDMLLYLLRPELLHSLLYTEMYAKYVIEKDLPARYKHEPLMRNIEYFEVPIPELKTSKYIVLRAQTKDKAIVRMEMVHITAGEIWYLRRILLKRPIHGNLGMALTDSFGKKWTTYQESAIADGFVKEDKQTLEAFQEAVESANTAKQLRGVFIIMMIQGYPVRPIYENHEFKLKLMEDFMEKNNQNLTISHNLLLQDFQKRLKKQSLSLETYGFPPPLECNTELEEELLLHCPIENELLLNRLLQSEPNNQLQSHYFHELMPIIKEYQDAKENMEKIRNRFIFLAGAGGVGKTALFKKYHAFCRSKGVLIKVCAATTLAALLYDHGVTAHNLFKFPVVEETDKDMDFQAECELDKDEERLECLTATVVIFWDEFCSNDKELFEAVIRYFRQRGKGFLFVCAGDPNQIGPVVKYGKPEEVIGASILSSPLWKQFEIWTLTENMRVKQAITSVNESSSPMERLHATRQLLYAESLISMATSTESENCTIVQKVDMYETILLLSLPTYFITSQLEQAINWLFDGPFAVDKCVNCVVLAANNKSVDAWNHTIQSYNEKEVHTLTSTDYLCDVDDEFGHIAKLMSDNTLNSFNKNGVPPHSLTLKVNDICLITRAMMVDNLPSNARVKITKISHKLIWVLTIMEKHPRVVAIPKIRFRFRMEYGQSFTMMRTQFPLRLAYAMSYNKCQSQTLLRTLVDCTEMPFAHGHLYVASSRVRSPDNIAYYFEDANEMVHLNKKAVVTNIVYRQLILLPAVPPAIINSTTVNWEAMNLL